MTTETHQMSLTRDELKLLLYGLHTRIAMAERVDGVITAEHQAYLDLQKKLRAMRQLYQEATQ